MRLPLNAGENSLPHTPLYTKQAASMRPPLNAGENNDHYPNTPRNY